MRINLSCPYAEKDDAKALGARWDARLKTWYIEDVEDLTPFMRWLRDDGMVTLRQYVAKHYGRLPTLTKTAARAFGVPFPLEGGWLHKYGGSSISADVADSLKLGRMARKRGPSCDTRQSRTKGHAPKATKSVYVPHCGCTDVLPWEDCEHTAFLAVVGDDHQTELDRDAMRHMANI